MIKTWIKWASILALTIVIMLSIAWGVVLYYINQPLVAKERVVIIHQGASLSQISKTLKEKCHLPFPSLWVIYGRIAGWSRYLRAGEYQINAHTTGKELYTLFSSGQVVQHRITLIAGMTMKDVLGLLHQQPYLEDDVKGLSGKKLLHYLGIKGRSPEGLFYPNTYFYVRGSKASAILIQANLSLTQILDNLWLKRASNLPFNTPYEALILASIIEKETGVPYERAEIAGVFVRRLKLGMRLQSDPTVIYGMGDQYMGKLTKKDLRKKTPYNTYRINGLPPTPIALVTQEDIQAALHPKTGESLYFVAKGDGTHIFSATLAEQKKAIKKYQLNRRADYRSSPNHPTSQMK